MIQAQLEVKQVVNKPPSMSTRQLVESLAQREDPSMVLEILTELAGFDKMQLIVK
jgi:hypothetical protein